ncbi:TPA: hypothetical protein ACX6PH_003782, partial [Photobacterium damselae]
KPMGYLSHTIATHPYEMGGGTTLSDRLLPLYDGVASLNHIVIPELRNEISGISLGVLYHLVRQQHAK